MLIAIKISFTFFICMDAGEIGKVESLRLEQRSGNTGLSRRVKRRENTSVSDKYFVDVVDEIVFILPLTIVKQCATLVRTEFFVAASLKCDSTFGTRL